jgi:hypothetical protein
MDVPLLSDSRDERGTSPTLEGIRRGGISAFFGLRLKPSAASPSPPSAAAGGGGAVSGFRSLRPCARVAAGAPAGSGDLFSGAPGGRGGASPARARRPSVLDLGCPSLSGGTRATSRAEARAASFVPLGSPEATPRSSGTDLSAAARCGPRGRGPSSPRTLPALLSQCAGAWDGPVSR